MRGQTKQCAKKTPFHALRIESASCTQKSKSRNSSVGSSATAATASEQYRPIPTLPRVANYPSNQKRHITELMRDYSQAAQTWRARPPVEPEEEAPADEETGSLGGHSAHSGKAHINDHTINTTASDLTSVREGEVSTIGGVEDSLLADSYEQQQQLQQSRQDDQYAGEEEDENDDDVLDPAELEMLNGEAERMKGIGNRHMANQEFNRACNAYSAALKLSPVGPSSHVFLSNRAAALLSLRQYSQAATDARRAIALAPTFSKAHARLGQALYFMRDYSGAVAAYEDAVQYEPDNDITKNYLQKAKEKEAKQVAKQLASRGGLGARYGNTSDLSLSGSVGDSMMMGANMSVVSDPNRSAAVVSSNAGVEGATSRRIGAVVSNDLKRIAGALSGAQVSGVDEHGIGTDEVDPDFDEALRLQDKATASLASKNYKEAIESYSAALFLVPDDIMFSPQLHIGRCHALNGLKRHSSAANDARLAIRLDPNNSEAHSALAKSLFYEGEYEDAIEAFEKSASLLAPGESVSMFDQAYLEKAKECLIEEEKIEDETGEESPRKKERKRINFKAVVPKLRAPRFVSRQQVVESAPVVPPMPKTWPKQNIVQTSDGLKVGPERLVTFYSEAMGIRLNRGASDGIVRVVAVKDVDADPGSPVAREGHVELGDVVREAAGVDLRRPVTSVMWSDTVALIKISPRPLELILAKELSAPPPTFLDELAKVSMQSSAPPTEVELPRSESPASNIVEEEDDGEGEEEESQHDNDSDDSDDDVDLEITYSEDGRALPSV